MCGMRSAERPIIARAYPSIQGLPLDALFATGQSLFTTNAWWQTVLAHALPQGAEPRFIVCWADDAPVGLFPLLHGKSGGWSGFTTPYSCLYTPLIAPNVDPVAVCTAFARDNHGYNLLRLDALPEEWADLDALIAGARKVGLTVRRFSHFGNWYEDVAGLDWAAYLARRPGALRETIRRRLGRAERLAEARFTLVEGTAGLEAGIAAFETVYAQSWKEPEPFPSFNAALIRAAAAMGILRLGVWGLMQAGQCTPVAVQFWIVEHGKATVLKLAHDEAFKAYSPGTVLTAIMLRHLLDRERVREIDFGRGDDPYKKDWAAARRPRIGLLLANLLHPAGLVAILRHDLGQLHARWRRRSTQTA